MPMTVCAHDVYGATTMKNATRRGVTLLAIVIMVCCLGETATAAEKIVMTVQFPPDQLMLGKWVQLIYTEAFQTLGLEMECVFYPIKRGDALVENGEVDGALSRPFDYATVYTNLIRVEEPAPVDKLAALAKDATLQLNGWESLKGTPYTIDHLRGFVLAEINLPKVVVANQIGIVDEWIQGLKKLAAGRTDILLIPESIGTQLLKMPEFKDAGIAQVGVMQDVPLYAFLQPKHRDLSIKLADVLKQMKTEGRLEQLWQSAAEALQANR